MTFNWVFYFGGVMGKEVIQPKAIVASYGRTKIIKFICINCKKEYFPKNSKILFVMIAVLMIIK